MSVEILLPLMMILLFGLPHGAADGVIAYHLTNSEPKKYIWFLTLYLGTSVLVIISWILFPLISLGTFLIISTIHFGLLDTENTKKYPYRFFRSIVHGSTVLVIIPIAHANDVSYILEIVAASDASLIFQALRICLYFWVLGVLSLLFFPSLRNRNVIIEIGLISLLAYALPPLWAFCIYFCAIHSPRHFRNILKVTNNLGSRKKNFFLTTIITLISLVIVLYAAWIIPSASLNEGMIRATFIGLAALTIPHFLFIDMYGALKKIKIKKSVKIQ